MTAAISMELLLATRNRGKLAEIRAVLSDLPLNLRSLDRFPQVETVAEQGNTHEENAVLKATIYAEQTGLSALADDSGLEVDALGRGPGVFSARYAGEGASDSDRLSFLLDELLQTPGASRTARFICVVAIADSRSRIVNVAYGTCEGRIIESPRGSNGFGYDPIFVPQGYDATFAELPSETKNAISHRAKALKATHDFLAGMIASAPRNCR